MTNPLEVAGYREWPTLPTEKVILHRLSLLGVVGHQVPLYQSLEDSEEQHYIGVVDDGHVPPAQHLLGGGVGWERSQHVTISVLVKGDIGEQSCSKGGGKL